MQTAYACIAIIILKRTSRPSIAAYRAVDQVRLTVFIFFTQFTLGLNLVSVAALGCHRTVGNQRLGLATDLVVGSGYSDGSRQAVSANSYIQHARIVGDCVVALRYHAHIARAVDIGFFNFCRCVIFNQVIASGTACNRRTLKRAGYAHGHTYNIAFAGSVNIQVAHVLSQIILFICIGHRCRGGIFDFIYTNCNYTGQERIRSGQLHSCRTGTDGRRRIRLHADQRALAVAIATANRRITLVNRCILQACRIVLIDIGIRPHALGAYRRLFRNPDAHCHRRGFGCIGRGRADYRSFTVNFYRCNIGIVNFRPQGFLAIAFSSAFVAFRQGYGYT